MKRQTPGYHAIVLAAGMTQVIRDLGRILMIQDIIGADTAMFAIGHESPRLLPERITIGPLETPFDRVEVTNNNLVPITVRLIISEPPVRDNLVEFAALLAAVQALTPADTLTIVDRTVVAQTGVGATQILAANAARKWCLVTADLANANYVFLGVDNTVTEAANSFFDMLAGGSWREHYKGAVWACSTNGTEQVRAYEST